MSEKASWEPWMPQKAHGLFERTKYADFYFTADGFIEITRRVPDRDGEYMVYSATLPLSIRDKDFAWLPAMVRGDAFSDIPDAELVTAIYDIEANFERLREKWRVMGRPSRDRYSVSRVKALADLFREENR
ncbi:MAG: hypothetical protein JRM78_04400 [Nitrososphaerota archaeon]|nr:hypothetical protein [Nitrososphaerota archaeon]